MESNSFMISKDLFFFLFVYLFQGFQLKLMGNSSCVRDKAESRHQKYSTMADNQSTPFTLCIKDLFARFFSKLAIEIHWQSLISSHLNGFHYGLRKKARNPCSYIHNQPTQSFAAYLETILGCCAIFHLYFKGTVIWIGKHYPNSQG